MFIHGDFGALASEAGRLDDVAGRIDDRLARIRVDIDDFLVSGWAGSSASRFREAFDAWHAIASENAATLHRLIHEFRVATDEIAAGEGANAHVSDSLTAALPVSVASMMEAR